MLETVVWQMHKVCFPNSQTSVSRNFESLSLPSLTQLLPSVLQFGRMKRNIAIAEPLLAAVHTKKATKLIGSFASGIEDELRLMDRQVRWPFSKHDGGRSHCISVRCRIISMPRYDEL